MLLLGSGYSPATAQQLLSLEGALQGNVSAEGVLQGNASLESALQANGGSSFYGKKSGKQCSARSWNFM